MKFYVMTLFTEMIEAVLSSSIIGRAVDAGVISYEIIDIRDFTNEKHGKVDDYPYGGGAGMVMQAEPIYNAYSHILEKTSSQRPRCIYMCPYGKTFNQSLAKEYAALDEDIILLCGHYEGVDERVLQEIVTDYVSLGDFVITGGELAALVMIDAISRMVPGVLTNSDSGVDESFENGLLEYPQYTRPRVYHDMEVPEIILSGDHAKVDEYRRAKSIERTHIFRPDMIEKNPLSDKDYKLLSKYNITLESNT